jgi:hypothetical protein
MMRGRVFAPVVLAAVTALLFSRAPVTAAKPKPTPMPKLPVIYRAQATELCSALAHHVKPVVGMMLENDNTIAQSPPLFQRYNRDLYDIDSQDRNANVAERDLTLYHLEQLITPLAKNVIAMQRELEDPNTFPPHPRNSDERKLSKMRDELLKALAAQSVSLDFISGYVDTQQLAELQHEGTEGADINAINGGDLAPGSTPDPATPNPLFVDPNQVAGLAPNPYTLDPLSIPGIAGSVGNTPVSRLMSALQYVRAMTQQRENIAAQSIMQAANTCRTRAGSTPFPRP